MGAEFCQRLFLHLLRLLYGFYLSMLIWYITLIDLCILKNPCIPGINPTWSSCMSFLMCCWILLAKILYVCVCVFMPGLRERSFVKGKGLRLGLFKRALLALRGLRMSFDLCEESCEKLMQKIHDGVCQCCKEVLECRVKNTSSTNHYQSLTMRSSPGPLE